MTVVLGTGIVGLLTAYYLTKAGHNVTVIDREIGPALACSKANAGIVAVGHTDAWASPKALQEIIKAVLGVNPAVKIESLFDKQLLRWGASFLKNCNTAAHYSNSQSMMRLSSYSKILLDELDSELKFNYSQQSNGSIYLFKDNQTFLKRVTALESSNSLFRQLTVEQVLESEPALASIVDEIVGGFLSTEDKSGDCYKFSELLTGHLTATNKTQFLYGTEVESLKTEKNRVVALQTSLGDIPCENIVVALGCGTVKLLKSIGLKPQIYPVKGYSATYPIVEPKMVSSKSIIDETDLVAVARYGNRIRLTAMAEFDKGSLNLPKKRLDILDQFASATFGKAINLGGAEYWAGSRPTTPSGLPYLGNIHKYKNLWVNAGHGQLGWTMAAGSGQIISDLINKRPIALTGISERATWLKEI